MAGSGGLSTSPCGRATPPTAVTPATSSGSSTRLRQAPVALGAARAPETPRSAELALRATLAVGSKSCRRRDERRAGLAALDVGREPGHGPSSLARVGAAQHARAQHSATLKRSATSHSRPCSAVSSAAAACSKRSLMRRVAVRRRSRGSSVKSAIRARSSRTAPTGRSARARPTERRRSDRLRDRGPRAEGRSRPTRT